MAQRSATRTPASSGTPPARVLPERLRRGCFRNASGAGARHALPRLEVLGYTAPAPGKLLARRRPAGLSSEQSRVAVLAWITRGAGGTSNHAHAEHASQQSRVTVRSVGDGATADQGQRPGARGRFGRPAHQPAHLAA